MCKLMNLSGFNYKNINDTLKEIKTKTLEKQWNHPLLSNIVTSSLGLLTNGIFYGMKNLILGEVYLFHREI